MVSTHDEEIDPDQLQIKLDNPRHEEKDDVPAAMKELVENERVVELALDIAEMGGLNPMDRIGVVRDEGSPDDAPTFVAAEGNRRVAALMLLDDPERLPQTVNQRPSRVKRLKKANVALNGIGTVPVVVFPVFEAADPWIDRMHVASGADGARKRWNPKQQARRNGETSNVYAVALITAARKADVITSNEADAIAATNIQRVVSSSARRAQLGLTGTGENLQRTLAWDAFQIGLKKLMRDQLDDAGEHNSRALNSAAKLNSYVAKVVRAMGAPEPLAGGETRPLAPTRAERGEDENQGNRQSKSQQSYDENGNSGNGTPDGNVEPEDNDRGEDGQELANTQRGGGVAKDALLESAITKLGNANITELYYSITTVSARQHPMLVCVGCNTLLELLYNAATDGDGKGRLDEKVIALPEVRAKYGEGSLRSVSDVLRGLRGRANLGKHDVKSGGVHGGALISDMATLNGVFTAVAELAVAKKRTEK